MGNVVKVLFGALGGITVVLSVGYAESTDGTSLLLLIPAVVLIIMAAIYENILKWKAYMLYTNNKKN